MELKFSNHRVSLNVFDNSKTILSKISIILATLPKYLIIENLNNIKYQIGDINVNVIDILSELKTDNFNFNENQILNIKSLKNVNIKEDIINVFIYYNKLIEETIRNSPAQVILIILKEYLDKNQSVYDFMNEYLRLNKDDMSDYIYNVYTTRKGMKAQIQSEISENNKNNKKIIEQLETINIMEDDFEDSTTEFVLENYTIDMVINHKIINLLYLFNDCHTTDEVSFIYFNNFYKVNNNYDLNDKEISMIENEKLKIDTENTIVFKVLNNVKKNTYSNCYITINYENEIVVSFIYSVDFDDIEIIKGRIKKSITVLKDNVKIEINRYNNSGYYYMNDMDYNIYAIRDMILNDNFINQYMITNEFNISKGRKFKKQRDNIFLYSLGGLLGEFKCSLSQQYKSFYERKFYKDKSQDVSVTRIRLINIDDENIDNIKLYMYKFLRYYKIQEETLIKDYKNLNPEFEDSFKDKTTYEIDKNDFTEILGKGYKRVCQSKKQPIIINEEEKDDEKYQYYIEFPKNSSNSDIYTCEQDNEFKYVGLVALNNKPVPCCFKTDRRNTKMFKDYYKDEEKIDETTSEENISLDKQQLIITTNKAVFKDNLGKLPENIEKLFNMSFNDTEYLRKGVNRGKKCFLECVLKALGIMKKYSKSEMKEELNNLTNHPECCKQEMYDESLKEIKRKILDEETYLDPKLYINLLSQFYNCNIILFTRDSENPKGTLQIPRNIKGYFKYNLVKKNTVFIYEHLGSPTNNLQYPTCEYIINKNMKNGYMEYRPNRFFLKLVNKIFYETEGSIFYNNMNMKVETKFLKDEEIEFLSQEINNFGKTVSLNVRYEENEFTIETSPMQPLLLPITKLKQPISYELIQEFRENILSNYVGEEDIESVAKNSIRFEIGTVEYTIKYYVKEKNKNRVYMKELENLYEEFNMNMKNAKYLMKNIFCMFSKYLKTKNEEVSVDRDFVLEFLENKIIIDEEFEYDELIKPEINKGYIYINDKIIITEDMKEKVIFALIKENMSMNNEKFVEMYDSEYIKDYYIDVNDLQTNNKEIIIEGNIESLKSIIDNNDIKYKYFNKLRLDEERYFLHNSNIDNVLFFCLKCKNVKECINVFINKELNNNLNKNDKEIPKELINNIKYKYTLYSYVNMDNIVEYSVRGENNEYDIKIIATKKDGENVFFALL